MDETNIVNENNQHEEQMSSESPFQMVVSENSQQKMIPMGNWMKFIGIIGMIFGVLAIMGGIVIFALGGASSGMAIMIFYLLIGVATIYISHLLYRSGKNFKEASELNDSNQLNEAISIQKTYFRSLGILTIVYLVLFLIYVFFLGLIF